MRTFKPLKSHGVDGILLELHQRSLEMILESLLHHSIGIYTKCMGRPKVVFISIVGKRDPSHPKSFRSIFLTSFVRKTMKKVGNYYISTNISMYNPLRQYQHRQDDQPKLQPADGCISGSHTNKRKRWWTGWTSGNTGTVIQCYVDDIVLICRGKYYDTLCNRIQTALNVSSSWPSKVGLRINPGKATILPSITCQSLDYMAWIWNRKQR